MRQWGGRARRERLADDQPSGGGRHEAMGLVAEEGEG